MNNKGFISSAHEREKDKSGLGKRGWITLLCLVCLVVVFSDLGGQWKCNEKVFRVFLRERSLVRFSGEVDGSPRILAKVDEYLLVTNR